MTHVMAHLFRKRVGLVQSGPHHYLASSAVDRVKPNTKIGRIGCFSSKPTALKRKSNGLIFKPYKIGEK